MLIVRDSEKKDKSFAKKCCKFTNDYVVLVAQNVYNASELSCLIGI